MCDLYLGPPRKTEIPDFYKKTSTPEQEVVEVYSVIVKKTTNIGTGKQSIATKKVLLGRATYCKPEPEENLSFSTRYAYDKVNLLNKGKEYIVTYQNQRPEYTPWRNRYEQWLLDPQICREDDKVMKDDEPHYLLQDQAGFTGNCPEPYPRIVPVPVEYIPKIEDKFGPEQPIMIPMPFLTNDLDNHDFCMDHHHSHCNL